jgi:hypothetical protein
MTRPKSEGTEALSDEEQSKAIQAQIKIIAEARDTIQAAMRALPPPREYVKPGELGTTVASLYELRDQMICSLAEKYVDMAFASLAYRPPAARHRVESQISEVNIKAAELLELLDRMDPLAVEALHVAMKELNFRPAIKRPMSSAVIDRPPKAVGDIKGRLEVLIDAADRAKIPGTAKAVKGPHQKRTALAIAKAAVSDYYSLTLETPERSKNGFPVFLAAIFKALDRRHDSVESFAREACEWWESDAPAREDKDWLEKLPSPPPPLD